MYYEIRAWVVYTFLALFLASATGLIFTLVTKDDLQKKVVYVNKEKEEAVQKVKEYKSQDETAMKEKATLFLKAFMEIDPVNKQTVAERVKPYTTSKAQAQVVPPGQEQPTSSKFKVSSKITEMNLYYTSKESDSVSILARVKRQISVNNATPSELVQIVELKMIFDKNNWIVDNVQLLNQ